MHQCFSYDETDGQRGRMKKKRDGYCCNAPRLCYALPPPPLSSTQVPTRTRNYMQQIPSETQPSNPDDRWLVPHPPPLLPVFQGPVVVLTGGVMPQVDALRMLSLSPVLVPDPTLPAADVEKALSLRLRHP